jgi:hypothetical protein
MSKADVLRDALAGLARVDIGDMARPPRVKQRLAAVKDDYDARLAEKDAVEFAWHGPKFGEVSGGEVHRRLRAAIDASRVLDDTIDEPMTLADKVRRSPVEGAAFNRAEAASQDAARRFGNQVWETEPLRQNYIYNAADGFRDLERSGVPRAWTGKLAVAMGDAFPADAAKGANELFYAGGDDARQFALEILARHDGFNLPTGIGFLAREAEGLSPNAREFIERNGAAMLAKGMYPTQIINMARATFGG